MKQTALMVIVVVLCLNELALPAGNTDSDYEHLTGWFEVQIPDAKR